MAAQGLRDMDEGVEKIANPEELAAVRRQGIRVIASTVATAVIATALLFAV